MVQKRQQSPVAELRRLRSNYTNFYRQWSAGKDVPDGITLQTPADYPINEKDLPAAVQAQLARYRKDNPQEKIHFVKYMRSVNGRPELVIEDGEDLPVEAQLLTTSQTVTLHTAETAVIITELIIARRD